jgi:Flp pilus assembly protein CpaB
LVGLFLAVVAFVGIYLLLSGNQGDGGRGEADELPTVFATVDIPLGVQITADMVENRPLPVTQRAPDAFQDESLVIGEVARQNIVAGAQLTSIDLTGGTGGGLIDIECPATFRCMALQVDQVTGVGTLIKAGDYVDMVVGMTADKFPVVTVNPNDDSIVPVAGLNATTVKLLVQGMQVVGVLLPPPPAEAQQNPDGTPTNLTGQQEIVIVAATAQQAEIIKFAQLDASVTLALRSLEDFTDPNNPGVPVSPVPDTTSGVILRTLVDEYGVLVPQVIEAILPSQATP